MHYGQAIARIPASTCAKGLTTSHLGAPDYDKTLKQFDDYIHTLLALGLTVTTLPDQAGFPDSHFVEDTAIIAPEFALITHPGAVSRRGEIHTIAPVIARHRVVMEFMSEKAHMDGGDVLMVDKQFFVGLSSRTNEAGLSELSKLAENYGYKVHAIEVSDGLHLKSIVNYVGKNTLLLNEEGIRHPAFKGFEHIVLTKEEEYAGNTLWINNNLITPKGYPDTLKKLQNLNLPITILDTSEFRKMDGGLTCLSLRF